MNNIDKIILFFRGDKRAIDFINFNYDGIEFNRSNNSLFIQNMLVCENFKDQNGCIHKNDIHQDNIIFLCQLLYIIQN